MYQVAQTIAARESDYALFDSVVRTSPTEGQA
jgi:hypothetical protein